MSLEEVAGSETSQNDLLKKIEDISMELGAVRNERDYLKVLNQQLEEKIKMMEENLKKYFNDDQIEAIQFNNLKSARWQPKTIEKSLSLRYRVGGSNYDDLRKFLPLPSQRSLLRRLQDFTFSTGVNQTVIDYLGNIYSDLPIIKRRGVLIVDRMSIVPGEDEDKKGNRIGFDTLANDRNILASEGLIAMFCGTVRRFKQVIGHHYTEKSVKGENFKEFLLDGLKRLWDVGIWIDAIIGDQGPENTALFKAFGVNFTISNKSPSIAHPLDPTKRLWLIADSSHIKKNIGSHIRRSNSVNIGSSFVLKYSLSSDKAHFADILKVYRSQKSMIYQPARNLTAEVIQPDHYQKMKVRNATRLFHCDVSSSIDFLFSSDAEDVEKFLEMQEDEFLDDLSYNATAFLCRFMDRWSKITNNRHKPINLKEEEQIQKIQHDLNESHDFFDSLKFDNRQKPCVTAARLLSKGLSEMMEYYRDIGLEWFVPGWYTTDSVENVIGLVRRVRPKPTCKELTQQLRSEICKRFTECTKNSSYDYDDSFSYSETSFIEFLKQHKNENPEEIDESILHSLEILDENLFENESDLLDTSCFQNTLEINTFMYVAGFLVKKTIKKASCDECRKILVEDSPVPTACNKLLRLRQQEIPEQLVFPSEAAFNYLVKLENLFQSLSNFVINYDDSELKIYFKNLAFNAISFPEVHCEKVLKMLILNFVNLRVFMTRKKRDITKKTQKSSRSMT
jgi:hypothetical protein